MNRLFEIDLLRVVCVFLLVAYHSFAIYTGSWTEPNGLEQVNAYYWVGKFCYSFMLPMWVFISGYLWGYQVLGLKRKQSLKQLVKKKAQKLLCPCYIFGILYLLVTGKISSLTTPMGIYAFLSGVLHLWFLPMLFWVFIISYFLLRIRVNDCALCVVLLIVSIMAWNVMSLGVGGALYYLLYFQLGFMAFKHKKQVDSWSKHSAIILILSFLFVVLFVPLTTLLDSVTPESVTTIKERFTSQILMHIISLPLALLGIMVSYGISIRVKAAINKSDFITTIATCGFGIYIFHQFILMYLYYDTNMVEIFGSIYTPVIGLVISFTLSILFTWISLKTRIGRMLLT